MTAGNLLIEFNWGAIAIATIVYCAFSGIWHRQFMFGKMWERAMGFQRTENWKETTIYFVVPFISCLITTISVSVLIQLIKPTSLTAALSLGLVLGVGFAAAVTSTNAVIPTMRKPLVFGAITGSAHAIGITLVALIIYSLI